MAQVFGAGLRVQKDKGNCIVVPFEHIDAFMGALQSKAKSPEWSAEATSFVEVEKKIEVASFTGKFGKSGVPANGLSTSQFCVSLSVPVSGVDVTVTLSGMFTSGTGPVLHGFDGFLQVSAMFGFSWMSAAVGVKGGVKIEATGCRDWSQILQIWTAQILEEASETAEIKAIAKGDAKKLADLTAFKDKMNTFLLTEVNKLKAATGAKAKGKAMANVVALKILADVLQDQVDNQPGMCQFKWTASVAVNGALGGEPPTCENFPILAVEASYSWGAVVENCESKEAFKETGALVLFTPYNKNDLSIQLLGTYSNSVFKLSAVFTLPAGQGTPILQPIFAAVQGASNEGQVAAKFATLLGSWKAKGAAVMAPMLEGGLVSQLGGGNFDAAFAAIVFHAISEIEKAAKEAQPPSNKNGLSDKVKAICKALVGSKALDSMKKAVADQMKDAIKKTLGAVITDQIEFAITMVKAKVGNAWKSSVTGTVTAYQTQSASAKIKAALGGMKLPLPPGFKFEMMFKTGRQFDLFGGDAMKAKVWKKLAPTMV